LNTKSLSDALPNNPNESEKSDIDVTQGDWEKSNDPIYYSPSLKKWYCPKCRQVINTAADSGQHAKEVHGLLSITEQRKTGTVETEPTEPPRIRRDLSVEELRRLLKEEPALKAAMSDPADLALQINAEEEARYVSDLIKNPYILFYYAKMRDERIIYPEWTIADCLREGFLLFATKLGCYASFGQDMEALKQDPTFANIAIKIAEAWAKKDQEDAIEDSKETVITPEAD